MHPLWHCLPLCLTPLTMGSAASLRVCECQCHLSSFDCKYHLHTTKDKTTPLQPVLAPGAAWQQQKEERHLLTLSGSGSVSVLNSCGTGLLVPGARVYCIGKKEGSDLFPIACPAAPNRLVKLPPSCEDGLLQATSCDDGGCGCMRAGEC